MNQLELRDIHLPDGMLWWPPAPGWWLLLGILVLSAYLAPKLYRWVRHKTLKKRAAAVFDQIRQEYRTHADRRRLVSDVSVLLRRVMMAYRGRQQVAGLTGEAWTERLTAMVDKPCFAEDQLRLLARGQYARDLSIDEDALLDSCQRWINALPRSGSNVSV